jgi:hypothetical protein
MSNVEKTVAQLEPVVEVGPKAPIADINTSLRRYYHSYNASPTNNQSLTTKFRNYLYSQSNFFENARDLHHRIVQLNLHVGFTSSQSPVIITVVLVSFFYPRVSMVDD